MEIKFKYNDHYGFKRRVDSWDIDQILLSSEIKLQFIYELFLLFYFFLQVFNSNLVYQVN
jgi:hypothetical protein